MSQQELAKQHHIARAKVFALYGMTKKVEHQKAKLSATEPGVKTTYASYAAGLLDGYDEFADAIISKSPDDWYLS